MNQTKNSILITHNDMDGSGSEIVMKMYDNNWRKTIFTGYDNINRIVEEVCNEKKWSDIYIVDICPSEEIVQNLDGRAIIIDHHRTTKFLDQMGTHVWDSSNCATKLFYRFMTKKYQYRNSYLKFLADVIDVCDRFVYKTHEDLSEEAYNLDALHITFGQKQFIKMFDYKRPIMIKKNQSKTILYPTEETICLQLRNRMMQDWDRHAKNCEVFSDKLNRKYGVMFSDEPCSNLFNYIIEQKNLDYLISINVINKNVSLRSVGNTNVSKLAKKFGGGGHTRASGFVIKDIKSFLLNSRESLGLDISDKLIF